jgi:hypothetical protein
MHTDYAPKLSLREFAQIIGIHPLHLAGLRLDLSGNTQFCDAPYFQYPYQTADRVSRSEIANAIVEAETQLENQLGYRLLPAWEREEFHAGVGHSPRTNWGHVIAGGCRGAELLGTATVAWSDEDADTYKETGTLVINGLTTQLPNGPCEVRIFHKDHDAEASWEVKPLRSATLVAGTLTVKFWRETAVKPELYEGYNVDGIEALEDAPFVTELDVYRIFNDRTCPQQLLWANPHGSCLAGPDFATWNEQDAQMIAFDQRLGLMQLSPAQYSDTALVWSSRSFLSPYPVDAVNLYYYAGYQDKGKACGAREMDDRWRNAVSYLAASMLDRPPCDCTADQWHYYREDLALVDGSEDFGTFKNATGENLNPFGTRRGAVMAWRRVRDSGVALGRGVAAS